MKLLILGGTVFLGRHIVEAALAHGHEVTLFHRGEHNPDIFPQVEKLHGDRTKDVSALQGRTWDAVIDTSGYVPRVVRKTAEVLQGRVQHYTFISSISVYADMKAHGLDESATVGTLEDTSVEEVTGETYGPLKALCEQVVEEVFPGKALIIRPGLIVGSHDPSDRFTYWPVRVSQGGKVLAPGKPELPTQFIDVRDLAAWIVRMIEARKTGVYNATGPDYTLSMEQFLTECQKVTGSDAQFVWEREVLLKDREDINLQPWVPEEYASFYTTNCQKAFAEGLTFRPLAETIRDTLEWKKAQPDVPLRSGLTHEQEQELLEELQKRRE